MLTVRAFARELAHVRRDVNAPLRCCLSSNFASRFRMHRCKNARSRAISSGGGGGGEARIPRGRVAANTSSISPRELPGGIRKLIRIVSRGEEARKFDGLTVGTALELALFRNNIGCSLFFFAGELIELCCKKREIRARKWDSAAAVAELRNVINSD